MSFISPWVRIFPLAAGIPLIKLFPDFANLPIFQFLNRREISGTEIDGHDILQNLKLAQEHKLL